MHLIKLAQKGWDEIKHIINVLQVHNSVGRPISVRSLEYIIKNKKNENKNKDKKINIYM